MKCIHFLIVVPAFVFSYAPGLYSSEDSLKELEEPSQYPLVLELEDPSKLAIENISWSPNGHFLSAVFKNKDCAFIMLLRENEKKS